MKQLNDGGSAGIHRTTSVVEKDEIAQIKGELMLLKKKNERLEKKERQAAGLFIPPGTSLRGETKDFFAGGGGGGTIIIYS